MDIINKCHLLFFEKSFLNLLYRISFETDTFIEEKEALTYNVYWKVLEKRLKVLIESPKSNG